MTEQCSAVLRHKTVKCSCLFEFSNLPLVDIDFLTSSSYHETGLLMWVLTQFLLISQRYFSSSKMCCNPKKNTQIFTCLFLLTRWRCGCSGDRRGSLKIKTHTHKHKKPQWEGESLHLAEKYDRGDGERRRSQAPPCKSSRQKVKAEESSGVCRDHWNHWMGGKF